MLLADDTTEDLDGEVMTGSDLVDSSGADMSLPEGVNQEWLLGELWKDLLRGEHARAVLAEANMRRVIETSRKLEHHLVEGLGQTVTRIPLDVYLHWTAREGQEFWHEASNLDYFARLNPGFKIESVRKASVVVDKPLPHGRADFRRASAPAARGLAAGVKVP